MNVTPMTIAQVREFLLAGAAVFTVTRVDTGMRVTYRVQQPDASKPHFVSVLTGPDNSNDYAFLGTIFESRKYVHGQRSRIAVTDTRSVVFLWLWERVQNMRELPANVHVLHEGKCGRCGRRLTTVESIERGIGPECIKKVGR